MKTICIWVQSFDSITGKDNRIAIGVMSRYTALKRGQNDSVFGDRLA